VPPDAEPPAPAVALGPPFALHAATRALAIKALKPAASRRGNLVLIIVFSLF
jgi:hypothetical protein